MKPGSVRIGTSGWNYRHWRGIFYPERLAVKRWFAYYSQYFDTVEINNTFYHLPEESVFKNWARQAPAGFLYAVKASRFLTHLKKLSDPQESLERILGRARLLGRHLGPILYQLPPHWKCDLERLRGFVELLPRDLRHVFEFRDSSWCNDSVRSLLAEHGMNYCIHDNRNYHCQPWVTGKLVYLRFHSPVDPARGGRYDRHHLKRWARQIKDYQLSGLDVCAYFNNDVAGHAVVNSLELKELLGISMPEIDLPLIKAHE